uniref:VWFA domain-containing protein n=1 Tax=Acrobeloides nanus TaxID=290746 RepID=A0A914DDI3_9BILA
MDKNVVRRRIFIEIYLLCFIIKAYAQNSPSTPSSIAYYPPQGNIIFMVDNSLVTGKELNAQYQAITTLTQNWTHFERVAIMTANTTNSSSRSVGAFTSRQDFLNGLNNMGNYTGKLRLDSWLQEAATRFPSSSSTTTSFIIFLNHQLSFALPADQGVAAAASLVTNLQSSGQCTLIALSPSTMTMSRLYSITPNFVEWQDLSAIPSNIILALRAATIGGGSRGEMTKGWTTPDYEYSGSGSGENQGETTKGWTTPNYKGSGGSQGNTTKGWTTPDYEGSGSGGSGGYQGETTKGWTTPDYEGSGGSGGYQGETTKGWTTPDYEGSGIDGSGGSQGNTTKGWTTPDYEGSGIGGSGGYQGETTKGWTTPNYKGSGGSQGNTTKVWSYWWTTPDYKSSGGGGSQGNTTKGPYWLPYWNVPAKLVFQNH